MDEVLKVPAHVWKEMFGALLKYDDTAELGQVGAPTLLLWGDADAGQRRHAGRAPPPPGADLLVYPAVGHTPHWEVP